MQGKVERSTFLKSIRAADYIYELNGELDMREPSQPHPVDLDHTGVAQLGHLLAGDIQIAEYIKVDTVWADYMPYFNPLEVSWDEEIFDYSSIFDFGGEMAK